MSVGRCLAAVWGEVGGINILADRLMHLRKDWTFCALAAI